MSVAPPVSVRLADWAEERATLGALRHQVFVREQGVPAELEIDGQDPECVHVIAVAADGRAVGTGRLLPDGHVGRVAVLPAWRGRGVGRALMQALIREARARGHREVLLNAQLDASDFYSRLGFVAEGEPFTEAGILHQTMRGPCTV